MELWKLGCILKKMLRQTTQLINILVMNQTVVVICKHAGKLSATVSINKMKFKKIQFKNTEIINKCQ